jgi:hypothetical protein
MALHQLRFLPALAPHLTRVTALLRGVSGSVIEVSFGSVKDPISTVSQPNTSTAGAAESPHPIESFGATSWAAVAPLREAMVAATLQSTLDALATDVTTAALVLWSPFLQWLVLTVATTDEGAPVGSSGADVDDDMDVRNL